MNKPDQHKNINYLLFLLVEGGLDAKGFELIETWLSAGSQNREYYCHFVNDYAAMKMQVNAMLTPKENDSKNQDIFDREAWLAMAKMEKDADIIKIAAPEEPKILIQKVQYQAVIRKISKGSLFTLCTAAAAIILIVVFARFAPPATGIQVAVLSDSIHAKWADMDGTMEKGSPLLTSRKSLLLREGIVELLFDNQAKVVIEAPAEFELLTGDQIKLQYGRVYAMIPRGAIGFTIYTPTARIIDLGTEFGVSVDISGDSSLYVVRGRTTLIAGERSSKASMEVNAGNAKKVSGITRAVSDITFREDVFVRNIDSKKNAIWKGQTRLNLADIVGGGDGFGIGTTDVGIDPGSGNTEPVEGKDRITSNAYRTGHGSPFVDGVFVPNGKTKQIISSQGHVFEECPVTCGNFFMDIANTYRLIVPNSSDQKQDKINIAGDSFLVMHANAGITFDMNAIRGRLSDLTIKRFQSQVRISEMAPNTPNADFWILVDGKVRYSKRNVTQKDFVDTVSIELHDNDRFLTLVATDGGDPEKRIRSDGMVIKSINSDWCVFNKPVLVLK